MKLSKKLIPISAALSTVAIVLPTTLTSCGNVYVDVTKYGTEWTPNYKKAVSNPLNETEATEYFFNNFNDKNLDGEIYWTSAQECVSLPLVYKETYPEYKITKWLIDVSNFSIDKNNRYVNYKLNCQYEFTHKQKIYDPEHPEKIIVSKSYENNVVVAEIEFCNIQFSLKHGCFQEDKWWLIPDKYTIVGPNKAYWNDYLIGNEKIVFNIRHERKGYSENGIQNYAYDNRYGAIVDEDHKYTPELDEIVTNMFLFYSYYMDDIGLKAE